MSTTPPAPQCASVPALVAQAVASTMPGRARMKALAAIRWVLVCESGYANQGEGLGSPCVVADLSSATVFDGRDSEETKARYYSAVLKTHCVAVLLP